MNIFEKTIKEHLNECVMRPEDYIDPSDGLIHCGICGMPREAFFEISGDMVKRGVSCPCDLLPAVDEMKRQRVKSLRENGLHEESLWECTFAHDNGCNSEVMEKAKAYVQHWDEMKEKGAGLLLWGDIGTGKSYIAACIANALIDRGVKVCMTNFARILNALTGLFSDNRNNFLDDLNSNSLLILDDFGMERSSEFAMEQLFNVIDSRSRSGKPMIITTNLSLKEIRNPSDMAHARIFDRILERCIPLKVNQRNLRRQNAEKLGSEVRALLGTEEGAEE